MKLKVGDIFTIPVSSEKTGFGQIINIPNKNNFIIIVFENIYSGRDWPSIKEVTNDQVLFFGYTMDALLYHKEWRIVGNDHSNISEIKLPYYKLGTPPDIQIVNYKGEKIKKGSIQEFNQLEYQTVIAPVRYELALQAYHKFIAWKEDFDKLLYERVLETIRVVERK